MRELSILWTGHRINHYAAQINPETLKYCDLTIIINGTLHYTINGQAYTFNKGDILFAPAQSLLSREKSEMKATYICFNFQTTEPINLPPKMEKALDNAVSAIIQLYDELAKHFHFGMESGVTSLLDILITHIENRIKSKTYHPLTLKIINYIHMHLSSKLTLEQISKKTFFSPGYCEAIFKADMNKSINDYIITSRIDEAKRLLAGSARSLESIAESVGFNDYNYFARMFKKRTSYTPTEYRKIVINNGKTEKLLELL